jgi:hypothetical protein
MRYLSGLIIVAIVISSCENQDVNNDYSSGDLGKMKESEVLDTCQCSNLDVDTTDVHFLNEKIYTGICLEYYPESKDRYIEKNLLNGKIHGKVTYFNREGEILIEEVYDDGKKKRSGDVEVLTCACSELMKEATNIPQVPFRYLLDDIPYTGSCEEYYPDMNQLYMRINYRDGILQGYSSYFNKDGSTLLIQKYENGELISAIN